MSSPSSCSPASSTGLHDYVLLALVFPRQLVLTVHAAWFCGTTTMSYISSFTSCGVMVSLAGTTPCCEGPAQPIKMYCVLFARTGILFDLVYTII